MASGQSPCLEGRFRKLRQDASAGNALTWTSPETTASPTGQLGPVCPSAAGAPLLWEKDGPSRGDAAQRQGWVCWQERSLVMWPHPQRGLMELVGICWQECSQVLPVRRHHPRGHILGESQCCSVSDQCEHSPECSSHRCQHRALRRLGGYTVLLSPVPPEWLQRWPGGPET